jgi:hypothetical protein
MGVYVYKSLHMDAIKIGHYAKQNAWSRIARRGFYSCIRPNEIEQRVSVNDVELLYWFPHLTAKDEKKMHKMFSSYSLCGEWFSSTALDEISKLPYENKASDCSKELAMLSRRRL